MQRFAPYLGIVAALILGALIASLSNSAAIVRPDAAAPAAASSTLTVISDLAVPTITLPSLEPGSGAVTASSAPAIPVPKKVVPPAPVPAASSSPAAQPVSAPAPLALSDSVELNAAAAALRGALVNIVCYVPVASALHSISGSGVIIDPKGIILTNAHVAQYFLLADRGASCTVRTGSPAADQYDAALIYISPAWLRANANVLTQASPSGTGQYDFAFLAITKSATAAPLPQEFPSLPLAQVPPRSGTPVVIASYGAQFLETSQIQSSLFPTVVFGSVKDVYTFGTNTIDVLALGGSAAAQEGSSGGGIADASGLLAGTITTSTVSGDTSTRSLDAITASYIRGEYASEMGSALDVLLAEPTATAVADFAPKMSTLEAIITAGLSP
ncbi:trypsin-like peptidase domain-containing protein [Patescibacteria group bacterium]|nr:trypsin-like peptidase domain-containing protein [Patescibacteria group bacterium]